MAVALACLAVAACAATAPKPMVARPGGLAAGDTLDYLGVNFATATFYDPAFEYQDLVRGKIPSWNARALEDIVNEFATPIRADVAISAEINEGVREEALLTSPSTVGPRALDESIVQQEIRPYVGPKHSGHGLLLVAEQLVKPYGVAHYVVFDRNTGAIVLLGQVKAEAGGFGPHNYYLNALKTVAEEARRAVNATVGGRP
jgi:hypothetical protein